MDKGKNEYELLDSGNGEKLERFGDYILRRPCSQAVWNPALSLDKWEKADASFDRKNGNCWQNRTSLPEKWEVSIEGIKFNLSGTDFGHLGVFPEQRPVWEWIRSSSIKFKKITNRPAKVLNLFAYSGGSTMAAALGGAEVCHLDASQGMVDWARTNAALNGLKDSPIRWIVDDVMKFLKRELKRGRKYDGIVLDPPSFGRGKQGEVFKIEKEINPLLAACHALLDKEAAFVILSAHTPGFTPIILENLLKKFLSPLGGETTSGEMMLTGKTNVYPLPNGTWARWNSLNLN